MDLTFTHIRKPQEIFEKGSKGTGLRRGLPAPLYPALLLKPPKGPFPGGSKVRNGTTGQGDQTGDYQLKGPRLGQVDHPLSHTHIGDASAPRGLSQGCTRTTHLLPPPGFRGPSPLSARSRLTYWVPYSFPNPQTSLVFRPTTTRQNPSS